MAKGIKDKVVIIGMGCSKFGERWDKEADNLMVEAYTEAIADAGIDTKQIDAAWLATAIEEQHVGKSATPLAVALTLRSRSASRSSRIPATAACRSADAGPSTT